MADEIDEAKLIAWIDGELDADEAARVERAVESDPALAAIAETHRAMRTRFTAAFGGLAEEPVALPRSADVVSLASVRAARTRETTPRRWWVPSAIAASLVVGLLIGQVGRPTGVGDRDDALALAPTLARALDKQLSGEAGPLRIALSFRAHDGTYCRSFTATHVEGIACRGSHGWRLRYAAPSLAGATGDYRMAGSDSAQASAVEAMIAGDPLDTAGERAARAKGWH